MNRQEELLQRLKKFSLDVLRLVKKLPKTSESTIYGNQVIRSSSSIGANYSEATCAHTIPDFLHDLNKCRKESKESLYWLELLKECSSHQAEIEILINECSQLVRIFTSSIQTVKKNSKSKF